MDSKEFSILDILRRSYVKITIIITLIIIILMYSTQSYWMNFGITTIYGQYSVNNTNRMDGKIYITYGNYSESYLYDINNKNISVYVITSEALCKIENGYVKLLVINEPSNNTLNTNNIYKGEKTSYSEQSSIFYPRIVVLKVLEGCK